MRKGKPQFVEAQHTEFGACYGSAVSLVETLADREAEAHTSGCKCESGEHPTAEPAVRR